MGNGKNIIFLLLILIMLIPAGFIVTKNMRADLISSSLSEDKLLNVLFIIEHDRRPISTNLIAHYPRTRRAAMFDIPGNTGMILPQLGRTDGIAALYVEKGIDAYKAEIEKLVGIEIPFYITCTLEEFAHIADILGGLTVFIPSSIDIESEECGKVLLPSGSILLDGDKIRKFLLYTSEFDAEGEAITRKQKAILTFFRILHEHNEFFSNDYFSVLSTLLHANVSSSNMRKLLEPLCKLDSERLVPQRLTGAIRQIGAKTLIFPFRDGQQIKEIVRQRLSALASEEGELLERVYALEVLNGTEVTGLARTASEIYQSFGYDVISIGNANQSDREKTVLIDRIGNESVAKIVAQVIKCKNIESILLREQVGSEANVDFTLILGKDFNGYIVK